MNSRPVRPRRCPTRRPVRSSLKNDPPAELIQTPGFAHQLFMPKPGSRRRVRDRPRRPRGRCPSSTRRPRRARRGSVRAGLLDQVEVEVQREGGHVARQAPQRGAGGLGLGVVGQQLHRAGVVGVVAGVVRRWRRRGRAGRGSGRGWRSRRCPCRGSRTRPARCRRRSRCAARPGRRRSPTRPARTRGSRRPTRRRWSR
jgi:hypothetical protein